MLLYFAAAALALIVDCKVRKGSFYKFQHRYKKHKQHYEERHNYLSWQCLHQGTCGSSEDKWGGISKPGQGKKQLNLK